MDVYLCWGPQKPWPKTVSIEHVQLGGQRLTAHPLGRASQSQTPWALQCDECWQIATLYDSVRHLISQVGNFARVYFLADKWFVRGAYEYLIAWSNDLRVSLITTSPYYRPGWCCDQQTSCSHCCSDKPEQPPASPSPVTSNKLQNRT